MPSSIRSLENSVIRAALGGSSADLRDFRQARRKGRHAPKIQRLTVPTFAPHRKAAEPPKTPGIVSRVRGFVSRLLSRKGDR